MYLNSKMEAMAFYRRPLAATNPNNNFVRNFKTMILSRQDVQKTNIWLCCFTHNSLHWWVQHQYPGTIKLHWCGLWIPWHKGIKGNEMTSLPGRGKREGLSFQKMFWFAFKISQHIMYKCNTRSTISLCIRLRISTLIFRASAW